MEDVQSLPSGPLPSFMIGDFQLETSELFNEFMTELGVNWVTRNIANNLYPVQKISQDEDEISLITETPIRSTDTKFKLNIPWEETTADGRVTETISTLEGNILRKVQVPDPSTGYHSTQEDREFSEDGETMKMTLTISGKPAVTCIRVYKRLPANI
ncbi:myelin P2 protein [Eurytemora carolleeae]|uniref:myelin P2 protein n=1 Tax=Eurytemora carolleeae TaxID=1294199 RepID=UPI000C76E323|nr:myelin P2 protein [Eurytemora carolleeae]|eukprot:XP_023323533.1 myelin P2 protein-like [Eurytemora affinis]